MFKIRIIASILVCLLLLSCNTNNAVLAKTNFIGVKEKVVVRDTTINTNNSYNDIFLDSDAVEHFITAEKLNDTISIAIRSFYNARNFEYAWFSSKGLIEQSFSFRSLYSSEDDHDVFNKSLENRLDRLRILPDTAVKANDASIIKTELQITERFVQYALKNYSGMGISITSLGKYIPTKRRSTIEIADSVLANNSLNNNYAALNDSYNLLKTELRKYTEIEKYGGWAAIPVRHGIYIIGSSDPIIGLIKKRLQITGALTANDTSQLFSSELADAIKTYQISRGQLQTDIITQGLIKDLNISALSRIQQILINMQRMRWMPTSDNGILIIVNIPEFEVYVDSGKKILFQMDAVVGAQGHNTTMFSGKVSQLVFSPYWNIPPGIVSKEIVPGIRREKNYLEKRDMEITGRDGGLPVVRQRPGPKNALGKVKLLFPNSFNIYMHDTPEKAFFGRTERDLSHGCIRLSDAPKMAYFLLRNSGVWTPEKINVAMNSGKEQFVRLKDPIPVIITYYTAWVDDKGVLHFADDIYGHDREMSEKMFLDPQ